LTRQSIRIELSSSTTSTRLPVWRAAPAAPWRCGSTSSAGPQRQTIQRSALVVGRAGTWREGCRTSVLNGVGELYAGKTGVDDLGTRIERMGEAPRIGILAVQGNFREHAAVLRRLGAEPVEVRKPEQLGQLDGLVIPGGESTAIMRLVRLYGLEDAIREFARPVLGTCAGMILLDREHLGLLDVEVARNAYGRQVASFEADLELAGEERPLRGVFIRAPRVVEAGPEVEVLAELDGEPVLLRQGRLLVASFHPELTDDTRVHERFLELVQEERHVRA
jgi:5'-phosphate synthase pdxT subunit